MIDTTQPPQPQVKPVRAVFLSDFHLGYKGTDGRALLNFIESISPEIIYLVGDIVDGWKLSKRWYWPGVYTQIFDALADHKKRGVKIVYLPGNHDEEARRVNRFRRARFAMRAGIRIRNSCIHTMKNGKRLIVLHGDQFDNILIRGGLSRIGDRFYDFISSRLGLGLPTPMVMLAGRLRPYSLAKALMQKSGKAALRLLNNFQRAALRLIKARKVDGLICGHTHVPLLRLIKQQQKILGNCGMWMGHTNTALIENTNGELELIRWPDCRDQNDTDTLSISQAQAVRMARHKETALVIRKIAQLWPDRSSTLGGVVAKTAQREIRIVDQVSGHGIHEGRKTALGDKFAAQPRFLNIRQPKLGQDAAGKIHAATRHISEREVTCDTPQHRHQDRQCLAACIAGMIQRAACNIGRLKIRQFQFIDATDRLV